MREELSKYSYLLSVPMQKSHEYEDGLLAYGYSILVDHVEKQNPGCVGPERIDPRHELDVLLRHRLPSIPP